MAKESIPLDQVKPGNSLKIRIDELIPPDFILIHGDAGIDYTFVIGESDP